MKGVTDLMLGEADEPMKQLEEYGDKVNVVVQERAKWESTEFPSHSALPKRVAAEHTDSRVFPRL